MQLLISMWHTISQFESKRFSVLALTNVDGLGEWKAQCKPFWGLIRSQFSFCQNLGQGKATPDNSVQNVCIAYEE